MTIDRRNHGIAADVIRIRIAQLLINEELKRKSFRVPVHLALGHEAIAAAISAAMQGEDALICTHRNIHYNLARAESFRAEIDELKLLPTGVAEGRLGSMNMCNPARGLLYSSSVLGNGLCIAAGAALATKLGRKGGAIFAISGDGAIEEGAFYETLELAKSWRVPLVIVVENNDWSLGTRTNERRCPIDLAKVADAFGAPFLHLEGNDAEDYARLLTQIRETAIREETPSLVEVSVVTLGSWVMDAPGFPDGKFINYHHGSSPNVRLEDWPVLADDESDPLVVLARHHGLDAMKDLTRVLRSRLAGELG